MPQQNSKKPLLPIVWPLQNAFFEQPTHENNECNLSFSPS